MRDLEDAPVTQSSRHHAWLIDRYWLFGWAILLFSLPLALGAGGVTDVISLGLYATICLVCSLYARRDPLNAIRVHLIVLVPYWSWYASLSDGLPARLDDGAAAHVSLLLFPILVLVAIDGMRGMIIMGVTGAACVLWRFGWTLEGATGLFLLSTALTIGTVFRRQTQSLARANRRLMKLANHDPEIDLPNRRMLDQRISNLADNSRGALLVVDLGRFKTVEEVYTHTVATALLRAVGERLQSVSQADAPSYLGGDRFALLLPELDSVSAKELAGRIAAALETPFTIATHQIRITCRVGIANWPSRENLVSRADRALSRARREGKSIGVYDESQDALSRGLEVEIWKAIEDEAFRPLYQPVFDVASGGMVGVEALARWHHEDRGVLSPYLFVEVAEATGQIVRIDQQVMLHVARQITDWAAQGIGHWVAVNLSGRTLEEPELLSFMRRLAQDYPAIRGRLVLEVTEGVAMRDPERSALILSALSDLGFSVALDDFGTGHSSLAYLKRLPATHLKLDRMFVAGIGNSDQDEALIDLLLHLAKLFSMEVVAEGIETEAQLSWLERRGCHFAQGFLLARPGTPEEVVRHSRGARPRLQAVPAPDDDEAQAG